MNEHGLPTHFCPTCGHKFDRASNLSEHDEAPPTAGDLTLCIECGDWLVFAANLTLRLITAEEMRDLDNATFDLLTKATRAIRDISK